MDVDMLKKLKAFAQAKKESAKKASPAAKKGRARRLQGRGRRTSQKSHGARYLEGADYSAVLDTVVADLWDICLLHACRICYAGSWDWTCQECAGHPNQEPDHCVHGNFGMVSPGLVTGLWWRYPNCRQLEGWNF